MIMDGSGKPKKAEEGREKRKKAAEIRKILSSETFSRVPSFSAAALRFPLFSAAFLCFFCACAAPGPGAPASARERAVVFQTRSYALSKISDPELEAALPDFVAQSYESALKSSADTPAEAGFSYTLSPRGAVNPFSEVEVSCVIRKKYASRYGAELCSAFYSALDKKIKNALKNN
ncbi:MAG: hypothetical protein NTX59_00410 [Elusimicrobia bacterium]|nr:hypothetical protein [Elusimicrobiota bacterium]